MDIQLKTSYGSCEIHLTAENVKICESISEYRYEKKPDGKPDYTKRLSEDITDSNMDVFTRLLDDIVYYRKQDYDSSGLIEGLFRRLPEQKVRELLEKLNKEYSDD